MDVATCISTSDPHAEGSLIQNTSAEMSPVAHQVSAGKLSGRKPEESLGIALGALQHKFLLSVHKTSRSLNLAVAYACTSIMETPRRGHLCSVRIGTITAVNLDGTDHTSGGCRFIPVLPPSLLVILSLFAPPLLSK